MKHIKALIEYETYIKHDNQILLYQGVELEDSKNLGDYTIEQNPKMILREKYHTPIYVNNVLHPNSYTRKDSWTKKKSIEMFGDFVQVWCDILNWRKENMRVIIDGCEIQDSYNTKLCEIKSSKAGWSWHMPIYIEDKRQPSKALKTHEVIVVDDTAKERKICTNPSWNISKMKTELKKIVDLSKRPHFIHKGKYLCDKRTIEFYKIPKKAKLLMIHAEKGGDVIEFMSWLKYEDNIDEKQQPNVLTCNVKSLFHSLRQITDEQKLSHAFARGLEHIKKVQAETKDLKLVSTPGLLAIYLWTTNLLHRKVNDSLQRQYNLNVWQQYLHLLDYGLRQLPYEL
eukprot:260293_1